ncbi:MAG: sulfotransferase [Xenococcaceae cyanobacterium MO_167.B27]|nr:sulfotransferase [Xenococcaceae cyanobacterium MO_167.B27]
MTLPNFLIIGAQKAGSSWLAYNLRQHPDIFMPNSEIYFFNKEENFSQGTVWYEKYFTKAKDEKLVGEKTPGYISNSDACLRIYQTLPNIKLIAILRNPVKRAISAINHHRRRGRIPPLLDINTLLLGILSRENKYLTQELSYEFIARGKYYSQLKTYYDYFSKEQILVLTLEEDIVKQPAMTLKKVCDFLEVDSSYEFPKINKQVNKNKALLTEAILSYYLPFMKPINPWLAKLLPRLNFNTYIESYTIIELQKIYKEENEKLFTLLQRRIESWQ